jgi:hypothetical protein
MPTVSQPRSRGAAEDNFLEYFTRCQCLCLRRIYDEFMIVNENRRLAMPFVMMAFAGMDYSQAVEALKGMEADFFITSLIHDEVPKENLA